MDGIERHAVYSNGGKGVINIRQIALALEGVYVKNREEFVVVGWTDPEGARPWLGALLLALLRPGWKAGLCRPRRHRHRLCGA
jgi:ATP-dependent DNA ligase